jgi:class 3 adenylate cyclase/predicted ATPase
VNVEDRSSGTASTSLCCAACRWTTDASASFCGGCGQPLLTRCPSCGGANPAANRFCQHCGTEFSSSDEVPGPDVATPELAGERRHLTVMFCDLANSTALSERLDPEDMREVVRSYHSACAAVIEAAEGFIAHYLGDGILAYFGYPAASEDDPVVAVRAGLDIVDAVSRSELGVRVGVHTGLAVIGEMGAGRSRQASDVVGETPNVAARLQGLAGCNQVVMSATTARLVEGFFVTEALGEMALKGISRPMPVFRVLAETKARSRLEVAAERGLTPLVGRAREMAALTERWVAGDGAVVFISGEPGIGKSRLVREIGDRVSAEAGVRLELRCSPHHRNTVLHPVVDMLARFTGADPDPDAVLDAIEQLADQAGIPRSDAVPVVAGLLGLPYEPRHPTPRWSPELRKHRTLDVLADLVTGLARRYPLAVAVEDIHWMDPTTLELVGRIVDADPVPGLLVIITHRPEFVPPWPDRAHVTRLTLNRLSPAQVEEVVDGLVGGHPLGEAVRRSIGERTDGVPLFVEELTRMVIETGASDDHGIPLTLRDSLMARLDRLGPARDVAQMAATIGREAPLPLLRAVAPAVPGGLDDALRRLVDAGLLYPRGLAPDVVYLFRHALVQDAAYDSILRSTRQQFHRAIADALDKYRAGTGEAIEVAPEVVGYHCAAGGLTERAIAAYQEAGRRAIAVSGNREAIAHLRLALDLVATLPVGHERDRTELSVRLMLGAPMAAALGYAAPDVEANYSRAGELCRSVDDPDELFGALYGMFRTRMLRAEYDTILELGVRLEQLAAVRPRPALALAAHRALGTAHFYRGELAEALRHVQAAMAERAAHGIRPGDALAELNDIADPVVIAQTQGSCVLWLLGREEEAETMSVRALAEARALGHPFTLAFTLGFRATLGVFLRRPGEAVAWAEEALAYAENQEILLWTGYSRVIRGGALVTEGDAEAGVAAIRQGIAEWQATGACNFSSLSLAFLAEGLAALGDFDEALVTVDEARRSAVETGERFWLAEIHRLRGQILVEMPEPPWDEAEAEVATALDVARCQGAHALEDRARATLGTLRQRRFVGS